MASGIAAIVMGMKASVTGTKRRIERAEASIVRARAAIASSPVPLARARVMLDPAMAAHITLEGKVAIVTGGSRGIGEAIARTFAAHGARVVLAARKAEPVLAVAESIEKEFGAGTAMAMAAHTGKEDECVRLVAHAVERLGRVDVLVNNAGTNPYFGPFLNADMGAWDKTFDVNLKGYCGSPRAPPRHCIGRDAPGSIVSIASVAGITASPLQGI